MNVVALLGTKDAAVSLSDIPHVGSSDAPLSVETTSQELASRLEMEAGRSRTSNRFDPWDLAYVLAAIASAVLILYLGRDLTFWADDWTFIDIKEPWTLESFMQPAGGHWFFLPTLEFKSLASLIGMRSHLPYLAVLVVLHLVTATAVYVWLKQAAGPLIAVLGAVLLLVLGRAGEIFFHAAAVNLVGAAAFGTCALVVFMRGISRRSLWATSALLVVAILFGGAGIVFAAVISVICLVNPARLRQLWVVAPGLLLYLAWLLVYGGDIGTRLPITIGEMTIFVDYVRTGLAHAAGALTGLGDEVGLVLVVILLASAVIHMISRRPLVIGVIAGAAGLVGNYAMTALARSELGVDQAVAPRYVYVAAVFLLIAMGGWLSTMPRIDRRRPAALLALAVVAGWAIVFNLAALRWFGRDIFAEYASRTRAAVTVLSTYGGTAALPWDEPPKPVSDIFLEALPSPHRLSELVARYGSPLTDSLVPTPPIPDEVSQRVLFQLVGGSASQEQAAGVPPGSAPPTVVEQQRLQIEGGATCLVARSTDAVGSLIISGEGGSLIAIKPDASREARLYLSTSDVFPDGSYLTLNLASIDYTVVTLPDVGPTVTWRARLQVPRGGTVEVCAASASSSRS